ncbi:MAG: tRNA (adenosine(37)-N6)-dimethylallyltransferase MiaA [Prolixibacteraceae bacterium]|jgi:tRNA dimethylallyltransferase|nr:tRNA (adenosine(37)-N6)-dimethylallyltransferase MiaA [Prolixibacteraceae bacterium]
MSPHNLITILGATASGKTSVASHLALKMNGEIISADSRQIYRGMDIGTGKDIDDYTVYNKTIPHHLIDIVDAGYQYNVFEYQRDFIKVYDGIIARNKLPIMCGGSGLYLEAILKGYKLIQVPVNDKLRDKLTDKSLDELGDILKQHKRLHNISDVDTCKRAIRAIEIEEHYTNHPQIDTYFPDINSLIVGVKFDRNSRRQRITKRLKSRLNEGMVEEVKALLDNGLSPEDLIYYGLEYKFITLYLTGKLSYEEMFNQLETAIHQFSKRQMTWFRRMEKQGFDIKWLDGYMPTNEKVDRIIEWYNK